MYLTFTLIKVQDYMKFIHNGAKYFIGLALIFWLGTSSCSTLLPPTLPPYSTITPPQPNGTQSQPTVVDLATQLPPSSTQSALPTTDGPYSLWVAPHLLTTLQDSLTLPAEVGLTTNVEEATLRLDVGEEDVISRWVYALVSPFPSIPDGVTSTELRQAWGGAAVGPFAALPILMDENTFAVFEHWWGSPGGEAVIILPSEQLLDYAWYNRPSWAIVPFKALDPRWKTLSVDGLSPLWKEFDPTAYALSVPISLGGEVDLVDAVRAAYGPNSEAPLLPPINRDSQKLTTVVMTGVTAMVRATAWEMEQNGITYPAEEIGGLLREADFTHISNELPFAENCPYPEPTQGKMLFCSDIRYIELLEYIGTDIVELSGDHFGDWGSRAMLFTLDMYNERGWLYYGGGANLAEGRQAITLEHNGNRLAFIGCNGKGEEFATATETEPGAVPCDYPWMQDEIRRLVGEGYLTIMTFQHYEYYTYAPQATQLRDFHSIGDAGATIISGSQAHQPQGMEFYNEGLIMYGLGNLFFDQFDISEDTRRALIARHVFYDGRHIGSEVFTIVFVDYARSRFATPEERADLLTKVFEGSGW